VCGEIGGCEANGLGEERDRRRAFALFGYQMLFLT
jgi:hypothetical protein